MSLKAIKCSVEINSVSNLEIIYSMFVVLWLIGPVVVCCRDRIDHLTSHVAKSSNVIGHFMCDVMITHKCALINWILLAWLPFDFIDFQNNQLISVRMFLI